MHMQLGWGDGSWCMPSTAVAVWTGTAVPPCRKVFGLLSAQLLITVAVAAPIVAHAGVKAFVTTNAWVTILAMLSSFGILLALTFSESARHSHPTNLILMGAFTVAEGVLVGAITSQYQMQAIILAAGMTAMITVGLTLYALNTKKDFTMQASAASSYSQEQIIA